MPLLATLEEAAFDALPDVTVLGKDSFVKNEKENKYYLALSGDEAGKLAIPLQTEIAKLAANNKDLLDEKINMKKKLEPWEKIGKTSEEITAILKDGKTPDVKQVEETYEAKLRSIEEERDRQIAAAKAEIELAGTKSKTYLDQLQAEMKRTVVAELKTKYDMNDLADDYLANRIQVVPEAEGSDKFAVRVFENGQVSYKAANFKTPAELAEEAKANSGLAGMFNAGSGGGSGSDGKQRPPAQKGFVNANDPVALGANIEALAKGEVKAV